MQHILLDTYENETLKIPTRAELRVLATSSDGLAAALTYQFPELIKLSTLLENRLRAFLDAYQGSELKVPDRAELREKARAIDCYVTMAELDSRDTTKASKRLQIKYHCDSAAIDVYNDLGRALMKENEQKVGPNIDIMAI